MSQAEANWALNSSVGYVLKQAAAALRAAMVAALRPLDLTVPQYACLELLQQSPGASNADLARGAFVTRQAMNGVLRGLQDRELVARPDTAPYGRSLPTRLTAAGEQRLEAAAAAVRGVEERMLADLPHDRRRRLREDCTHCAAALAPSRCSPPNHTSQ